MTFANVEDQEIFIEDAPKVPGLRFRHFRGETDFPHMVAIFNDSREADSIDWLSTIEDIRANYSHLENCDPSTDMIFVEVAEEVVGYGRCWWHVIDAGYSYYFFANLLPVWRGLGIRRAMTRFLQARLRQISLDHPNEKEKFFTSWAGQGQNHWHDLLLADGFKVVRYGFDMVRPSLDNIPDCPIPDGIEIRRGTLEEWRPIWEAARESFRDHWGMPEWSEESFTAWQKYPSFKPELWQIAWAGDAVVGGVLNFIDESENEAFDRQRGYTETIFVRRPWRKQGVAKALITRSFQVLKEAGMVEAALGVDGENPTGALHLYRKLGFEEVKRGLTFRKPVQEEKNASAR